MPIREKELKTEGRYLAFPVRPHGGERHAFASLWEGDTLLYEWFLDPDFENPAFWTYCDMTRYGSRLLRLRLEDDRVTEEQFASLDRADTYPGLTQLYHEPGRPQLHFSPARGYISDPNGLFYYRGLWHIFFQHDIFNMGWVDWRDHVNMAWGHATSPDLVHWTETPDVLLPDERGPAFSGSGLVDTENVSGLQRGEDPPILLYYTAAGGQARRTRGLQHVQCLAVSQDGGRSFHPYEHNPLIPFYAAGNRDPKIFWNPKLGAWMLITYTDDGERYLLYTSEDLLHFTYRTDFHWDNMECPDLLYLPVNGDPNRRQMVLWGANGSYVPMDFDGEHFVPLGPAKKLQSGLLHSCGQTFHNAPDGRCVQMTVYRMAPGSVSSGCLTVPCDLTLHEKNGDFWLWAEPVPELRALRIRSEEYTAWTVEGTRELPASPLMEIELTMPLQDAVWTVNGLRITVDAAARTLTAGGGTAPLPYSDTLRLRLWIDTVCCRIWESENRVSLEFGYPFTAPELRAEGHLTVGRLTVHTLKSIWEDTPHSGDDREKGGSKQ